MTSSESLSNIRPLAVLGSYLCLACVLTGTILRILYNISKRPSHAQPDSLQSLRRTKYLRIFAALSSISLVITWSYMLCFFAFSYQDWARNTGVPLPLEFWGEYGIFGEDTVELQLGRWLKDTTLFRDAWETVIDGNIRFWWSQQIFLITTGWSVYLGIEGHRRGIPRLWIFMLLGQIVAISFALNLFFLAIVLSSEHSLTDIKDARVGEQEKWNKEMIVSSGAGNPVMAFDYQVKQAVLHKDSMDQIWTPPRIFYTIPLLVTLVSVSLIPYSVHSRYFLPLLAVPHVLLFVPVMVYNIVPGSWGTVQPSHAYAKEQYVAIYRLIFWFSVCLYLKATVAALLDKNVDERDYPYLFTTLHHPRLGVRQRQHASRHQRYIGELFNHPAVGSVGWDVILCWLSAAMWVVIQGRSSWTELIKVMLPWKSSRSSNDETGKETSKDK